MSDSIAFEDLPPLPPDWKWQKDPEDVWTAVHRDAWAKGGPGPAQLAWATAYAWMSYAQELQTKSR